MAEHAPGVSRDVVIVPHTHWDREWYQAFQSFRLRLVDLLDELLPLLEADPGYAHFMLDGQMAVVDDYLAIRPEAAERLHRLADAGRLSMGPWYILMDEFLVSGETMVRDLQLGLAEAGRFGGALPVGYLPDMFGHVAQMPQLLSQFGFEHAVVWRGVPAAIDASAFWWEAPDGSAVRAEYLLDGYGNGAHLPDDAKDLLGMVERFEEQFDGFLADGAPILWMNGTDHLMPQPWLGRVTAEANEIQDRLRFRVGSLADYVALAPTDGLPRHRGELRSGARANLLFGVGSNRVDVKQAAAAAERVVEREAEPLSALYLPAERYPSTFLAEAWKAMILNAAHDSSCACSIDEVCDAVIVRYQEARQIGDGLVERAVHALGRSLRAAGPVVVNASARPRGGLVELQLDGHDDVPGAQVLVRGGGPLDSGPLTRGAVEHLLGLALNYMEELVDVAVESDDDGVVHVRLVAEPDHRGPRYAGDAKATMADLAAEDPDAPAHIAMVFPLSQRVLVHVPRVDGFGWLRWEPAELTVAPVTVDGEEAAGDVAVGNGLVTVQVDATDGTFALDGVAGYGRLVDDGDCGDTYNWCPPAENQVVDAPASVAVRVLERGPLRARIAVDRTYTIPASSSSSRRYGEVAMPTTTTIEVVAGSPLVRVSTEVDNQARDHRLRVSFPVREPAQGSTAECAFAVVERGLDAEGGPNEVGLPHFPSRRFVIAGGITVVHDGLLEYELTGVGDDGASAIALTLLRCTGLISQGPMTTRPAPAGPLTPTPEAQMPGRHVLRYGVMVGDDARGAYAAVDDAFLPLRVTRSGGGGTRPDAGAALAVAGAEVSAVTREAGNLTVRVFNPTAEATTVSIEGRRGWLCDLRGRALEPFEGSFELGPWRIATAVCPEEHADGRIDERGAGTSSVLGALAV